MHVEQNKSLSALTTLGVGGAAEQFVAVSTEAELIEALTYAQHKSLPLTVLGGGSNVLVSDEGVSGLVLQMALKGIRERTEGDTVYVTALAGELFDDVVSFAVQKGYWGIENLSHIPGTVGATPVQNVGAYGVEVSDCIVTVRAYNTQTKTYRDFSNAECTFGYRDSYFKTAEGKNYVITAVTFRLHTTGAGRITYADLQQYFQSNLTPTVQEVRNAIIAIRSNKFPDWHAVGTAGSFFKNPTITQEAFAEIKKKYPLLKGYEVDEKHIKVSLGWILDSVLHVKGYKEGLVGLYEKQALVLVAYDGATAAEIISFANAIVEKIKSLTNISVEWEVTQLK